MQTQNADIAAAIVRSRQQDEIVTVEVADLTEASAEVERIAEAASEYCDTAHTTVGDGRAAVEAWLNRPAVQDRVQALKAGHDAWLASRPGITSAFRGGAYLLLHTLAHLLCQVVAIRSGYPSSAIRERIYADPHGGRYGILLYTGTADADGTLGGLVQEAYGIAEHLEDALDGAAICSNDPICAAHAPGDSLEERYLHGAACHGCVLIGETSCEARNDHLDRALVVPILGVPGTAFFRTSR